MVRSGPNPDIGRNRTTCRVSTKGMAAPEASDHEDDHESDQRGDSGHRCDCSCEVMRLVRRPRRNLEETGRGTDLVGIDSFGKLRDGGSLDGIQLEPFSE